MLVCQRLSDDRIAYGQSCLYWRFGIEKFLQKENERRIRSNCSGVISVHDGICYGGGKNYMDRKH